MLSLKFSLSQDSVNKGLKIDRQINIELSYYPVCLSLSWSGFALPYTNHLVMVDITLIHALSNFSNFRILFQLNLVEANPLILYTMDNSLSLSLNWFLIETR